MHYFAPHPTGVLPLYLAKVINPSDPSLLTPGKKILWAPVVLNAVHLNI